MSWGSGGRGSVYAVLSFVPETRLFHLVLEKAVQSVGTLVVLRVGAVVGTAVAEDPLHVSDKQPLVHVIVILQPLCHRLQVCNRKRDIADVK